MEDINEKEELNGNDPINDIDFNNIIQQCRNCNDSKQIELLISNIRPNSGNCKTRRLLKRLLENKVQDNSFQLQLNAKSRRKFQRILKLLQPDKDRNINLNNENKTLINLEMQIEDIKEKKQLKEKKIQIPYIVFIGQLPYDITEEDLRNHLYSENIMNIKSIRMINNKETKEFKGMAFVELNDSYELQKTLFLHHTFINGRRINVEKTVGGRNKQDRYQKIEQLKQEQELKIKTCIDNILLEHKDIFNIETSDPMIQSRIYQTTPKLLKNVFEKLKQSENQTEMELDRLLYIAKNKLVRSSKRKRSLNNNEEEDVNENIVIDNININNDE